MTRFKGSRFGAPGRPPIATIAGLPCQYVFNVTGAITATSTSASVALADAAGQTLAVMNNSSGAAVYIDSDSANDDVGNTGLECAYVHGFDVNGLYAVTDIETNGTTGNICTNITNFRTVFKLEPFQFGGGNKCIGNVTVQQAAAGTAYFLGISANGLDGSSCWFNLPPTVIAAFKLHAWATIGTTAYDAIRVQVTGNIDSGAHVIRDVAGTSGAAALFTSIIKDEFVYEPTAWEAIKFSGLKVGTTNQVINYNLQWGFRFK
jgi:hypothetical protein